MIKQAKRPYWRNFCGTIGNTTPVSEVWGMIKKMGGDRRKWTYPVLINENEEAVNHKDKA